MLDGLEPLSLSPLPGSATGYLNRYNLQKDIQILIIGGNNLDLASNAIAETTKTLFMPHTYYGKDLNFCAHG